MEITHNFKEELEENYSDVLSVLREICCMEDYVTKDPQDFLDFLNSKWIYTHEDGIYIRWCDAYFPSSEEAIELVDGLAVAALDGYATAEYSPYIEHDDAQVRASIDTIERYEGITEWVNEFIEGPAYQAYLLNDDLETNEEVVEKKVKI